MLMLVQPPPGGNATDPPKRRRGARSPALSLTTDEARHLRATVKNTARAYGGLDVLASVIGVDPSTLNRKTRPSPALALAVARAAGMSVEAVIGGKLSDAGRCSTCGHRAGDGRLLAAERAS